MLNPVRGFLGGMREGSHQSALALLQLLLLLACIHTSLVDAAILRVGNPLPFGQSKTHLQNVRLSGVEQFINHYKRCQNVDTPLFLWGDEVEYGIFRKYENKVTGASNFDLSLRGAEIREYLNGIESKLKDQDFGCNWTPEYGSWMVEAVPRAPYGSFVENLFEVEKNMQLRRKRLHLSLKDSEIAPSMSNFPMLGVLDQGYSHSVDNYGDVAFSPYIADEIINPHPRFGALTQNIRSRRGSNVEILLNRDVDCNKVSIDKNNDHNFKSKADLDSTESTNSNPRHLTRSDSNSVHMDAMAFGMGCCCLQITMQCRDEKESRFLNDQLTVLSPIFMALSASSPIFRGQLVDTDSRWEVISQAVDDRTSAERGVDHDSSEDVDLVAGGIKRLNKSRYSSISRYIGIPHDSADQSRLESLNDLDENLDELALKLCLDRGIDPILAKHIAHMFVRDPLVIFDDAIYLDNTQVLDHFDNVQSTNWRTVRWKAPSLEMGFEAQMRKERNIKENKSKVSCDKEEDGPGWRVEFRPYELQLTDFENAAYSIALVLFSRALLAQGYNFYMPISKVDENMQRSQKKDAVLNSKFYIRKNSFVSRKNLDENSTITPSEEEDMDLAEMSLDEIFNGVKGGAFPGVIPSIYTYLDSIGCDAITIGRLKPYLTLLSKRASGALPTTANWIRNFVKSHPLYAQDGNINAALNDELCQLCEDIGMGKVQSPELYGDAFIENLNCYSADEKEPFLLDNYDKLSQLEDCDCYLPMNSCTDSASSSKEDTDDLSKAEKEKEEGHYLSSK